MDIQRDDFGVMPDGAPVEAVTLRAPSGMTVRILTLGGILQSVLAPDAKGQFADVVLGFDDVAGYLASPAYHGAIIGRVAGRLAGGRIKVDGRDYYLSRNDGQNTLHGGKLGFDRAIWRIGDLGADETGAWLRLAHDSPIGDQGFPGALAVTADYRLDPSGALTVTLMAEAGDPTPVNLTLHPYWNLAGGGDVSDHLLTLAADEVFAMGPDLVPARAPSPVAGTPLDLRQPSPVGDLDNLFVASGRQPAARVAHPPSGRTLTIESEAPAIVAYGGAGLAGGPPGKDGAVYGAGGGLAIEPQARPDDLPILRPGETRRWSVRFVLGTDAS